MNDDDIEQPHVYTGKELLSFLRVVPKHSYNYMTTEELEVALEGTADEHEREVISAILSIRATAKVDIAARYSKRK